MRTDRRPRRAWATPLHLVFALAAGWAPALAAAAPGKAPAGKVAAPALTPAQERRAMEELAELYAQEGRLDDALALYAELRGREPAEANWWRRPCDLLDPVPERHADLLILLQGWRAAQPKLREPSERLVRFYEQDGAIDEGLVIVDALLAEAPKDLALLRLKAELLETGDRHEPALAAWGVVVAHPSATVEDRWRRAELLSVKGDSPALRAEYEALVKASPADTRFRVAYGETLLAADDLAGAQTQVEAAAAHAPEDPAVRKLAAEVEAERAARRRDAANDDYDRRDALRWRTDRAHRVRALSPQEDY